MTYTVNILKKVQDKYDIPLGELMAILSDGKCKSRVTSKKTGKQCQCTKAVVHGESYCRRHIPILDDPLELEYIVVQDKPYLYDPATLHVYSYGSKPAIVGKLSDDFSMVLV